MIKYHEGEVSFWVGNWRIGILPGMLKGIIKVGALIVQTIAAASVIFLLNPLLVIILSILILIQFVPIDRSKKKEGNLYKRKVRFLKKRKRYFILVKNLIKYLE